MAATRHMAPVTYGVEEMQYGGEYGMDASKAGEVGSSTTRNYNNRRYRGDNKGDSKQHSGAQQQQQQQPPQPQQQMPPQQQQMPPQHQQMQAGQHMPYAYQQLSYPPAHYPMYQQAAFYGGYQPSFPQAAAPYKQPNQMRPGTHAMPQYSFPAQGGGYATNYMTAAPATMGGYDYASYADGSYQVPDQPPATSGASSAGAADTKVAGAEIQQLAATGFHNQYAAAGYPAGNYYAGYAPQSAHMPQTGASMQQTAYGQQSYGGWQQPPSQGSR
jgi:hypothetical protein